MIIKVGKTSGFCYGVKNAVENAEKELNNSSETIYCLGELVHNKDVIDKLQEKGLKIIENIEEAKGKTIIRSHGVEKEIYQKAKQNNIDLIDLTCPIVLKIHKTVQEYSKQNYYIFLIGINKHPETIGTYSFCGANSTIISNIEDIDEAIEKFEKSKLENILVISQTTYSLKLFEEIIKQIKQKIPTTVKIEIKNTICLSTENRQKETEKLSKEVELMIIVGGKNSSNTIKLYEIALKNCKNAIFIQNKNDIKKEEILKYEEIGIMAGSSTPEEIIKEIIELLHKGG